MRDTIEAGPGERVDRVAARAIQKAKDLAASGQSDVAVTFVFNDIEVWASADSSPDDLSTIYSLKGEIYRLKRGVR